MLFSIAAARKSIYMEMYMLEEKTEGFDFVSELEKKSTEGVQVVIVLDVVGSSDLSSVAIERLRSAGVEVLFFKFWFQRTHRKLLIVDEKVAFVGGVNISPRYALWNDLQMQISGKIVFPVVQSFARAYDACGGTDKILIAKGKIPILKRTKMWFIEHGLLGKRFEMRKHYEGSISSAKESVVLVTPYFLPNRWLIIAIRNAILRGVKIEIIVPRQTDFKTVNRLNAYYLSIFSKLGAHCLYLNKMNHAKIMMVDNKTAIIGSQNLDALSFDWNVEAGVSFDKPILIRDLGRILSRWKYDAVPFDATMKNIHWYDEVIVWFLRWIQPVL
jgi:cardiolipin synthase